MTNIKYIGGENLVGDGEISIGANVSESSFNGGLTAKDALNTEFRMIISHRLMGYSLDMDKDDWEGMLTDLAEAAYKQFHGC